MLLEREYPPGVVDAAIAQARAIPRSVALRRVYRQPTNNRPVFVACYDPRLPSLPKITTKHWISMTGQDSYLESVFPEPPLVSYRRQKKIRETIIRAKVAPQIEQRVKKGMKKCLACSYIKECKTVRGQSYNEKKFIWKIGRQGLCSSSNCQAPDLPNSPVQPFIGKPGRLYICVIVCSFVRLVVYHGGDSSDVTLAFEDALF